MSSKGTLMRTLLQKPKHRELQNSETMKSSLTTKLPWDLMELDTMNWFGHVFVVAVPTPTFFTRVVCLGIHDAGESYNNREKFSTAYQQIHAYVTSCGCNVRVIVFDGDKTMATDKFLCEIRQTGA